MNKLFYGAFAVLAVVALAGLIAAAPAAADVTHLTAGALEFGRLSATDLTGLAIAFGMNTRLKDLRDKRGTVVASLREILSKAETEKRNLSAEEASKYDEVYAEQERLDKTIKAEERQVELEREAAQRSSQQPTNQPADPEKRTVGPRGSDQYRAAFRNYLLNGSAMSPEEKRALQVDTGSKGGYMVADEQFVADLIKALDNEVFIRRLATKIPVTMAQSLGIPSLDTDPDDADWTSELGTGNEDSAMAMGKRKMVPHPLAKRIKVSNDLLEMSAIGAGPLVIERLTYKFGIAEEKGFLTGNGVDKPLGVFTASDDGIPTSRDVSTGNATTSLAGDGLIEAKYTLKGQYQAKAAWLFHRDAVKQISKLKDNDGQYLWLPGLRDGQPDTILARPFYMSEYAPSTFTTGQYVGLYGDFSKYWIADAMDLAIRRLDELYAETNQVGFIGRKKTDGAPVLAEAFVRLKLL